MKSHDQGRRRPSAGGPPAPQQLQREPAPYHFVPIEPASAVEDGPVWHDRLDLDTLWSGELHCTLTALTPLLAANDQYELAQARPELHQAFETLARQRFGSVPLPPIKEEKKILEPLADSKTGSTEPGAVLIAGAALKGMIRHAVAALLSAPMERVQERTASYRPNIKTLTGKHNPIRVAIPAFVAGGGGWQDEAKTTPYPVNLIVLDGLVGTICFVHPDALPHLPPRIQSLCNEEPQARAARYADPRQRAGLCLTHQEADAIRGVGLSMANILKRGGPNSPTRLEGWLPVVNLNGIDLGAELNRRFHEMNPELARELSTKSPGGYPLLFVRLPDRARETPLNDLVLLRAFYRSLLHLADGDQGHLLKHPLIDGREDGKTVGERLRAFRTRGLLPGDIVYLEETDSGNGANWSSLGHHFYYRWRFRTTLHRTPLPADQGGHAQQLAPGLRDILCPRPLEMTPGRPEKLSAARLLFGFVGTSQGGYAETEPLTFGLGLEEKGGKKKPSDFAQLAGRVAVNMAVEQDANVALTERFLNADKSCLVPLRPLGSPKPSAVEHYLTQDRLDERPDGGILCTYGDTPTDAAVGKLRGRKHYLHQPDAASKPACYELLGPASADWKSGDNFNLLSDQASIGRFVSKPGRKFRFTIRLVNLRQWELGALLFALEPMFDDVKQLHDLLPEKARGPLRKWIDKAEQKVWHANPARMLAHKLGHGRPLGLGSVTVRVEAMRHLVKDEAKLMDWRDEGAEERRKAIAAFAAHMAKQPDAILALWVERCLVPWLQVHRYAGRTSFDYPRLERRGDRTIFNYHSELRSQHADGRKRAARQGRRERLGLPELDELDSR